MFQFPIKRFVLKVLAKIIIRSFFQVKRTTLTRDIL